MHLIRAFLVSFAPMIFDYFGVRKRRFRAKELSETKITIGTIKTNKENNILIVNFSNIIQYLFLCSLILDCFQLYKVAPYSVNSLKKLQ